jgi:hypothetical protein
MTTRNRAVRIGAFDALEDRVVLSQAQNLAIVSDVTSFYSNYLSTIPALVQAYNTAAATAATTGPATDLAAKTTAATNLTNAIKTDVNNLATQLLQDLRGASAQAIRTSISGGVGAGTDVTNTTSVATVGSLMNALLAVDAADPSAIGTSVGIGLVTDLGIGAAVALTQGAPQFPQTNFGSFTQTYFGDVQAGATQLKTAQAAASTPPTTDQKAAIDTAVASIDKTTVADVNNLATNLLTTMGTGSTKAIQQLVTGIPTTSTGVTFTGSAGSFASFGSLLGALQSIETDPILLSDPNTVAGIVGLFAFI